MMGRLRHSPGCSWVLPARPVAWQLAYRESGEFSREDEDAIAPSRPQACCWAPRKLGMLVMLEDDAIASVVTGEQRALPLRPVARCGKGLLLTARDCGYVRALRWRLGGVVVSLELRR